LLRGKHIAPNGNNHSSVTPTPSSKA